jgi:glycosyltransferase involved in cell wall biosynthesis
VAEWRDPRRDEGSPLLVLLLPRPLESFILRDQAQDLLRAHGAVALEPPRLPYGAMARLPEGLADALAVRQAGRLRLPGRPAAVAIAHPLQYPLARALLARHPESELWYWRWDRYEAAYDASPKLRARLEALHDRALERSALTFAVSDALADVDRAGGHEVIVVGSAHDSFPAPDPAAAVVAVSLGHLGRRTDWALLRALSERMPELVLLLVGEWHEDESGRDADFQACRAAPNIVWLGHRPDEEAARLILLADAGIVPFERSAFNDTSLPQRILKAARLGRRTVSAPLAGPRTWERAVLFADTPEEWTAALRSQAGVRTRPDLELREWALAQTARAVNQPLWERMAELGIDVRVSHTPRTR